MNPEERAEQRDLTRELRSLVETVTSLNKQLSMYAPREEVKKEGLKRAWRFFSMALAIIIVAQGLSMATISYCFLDANSTRHATCSVMPGYNEAIAQNNVRLGRFNLLLDSIELNQMEIQRLNARIAKLEKEQ